MKRRGLLGVVLVGLMVFLGIEAFADDPQPEHQHHTAIDPCAKACADCANECDSCFHHCARLVADGQKDHAASMYSCVDCAEFCTLSARLVSRQSGMMNTACEACAKACDVCERACEKFPSDAHMKRCAEACRDCAKACRDMIERHKDDRR
jgi:hypothetical protein